ncbi:hypothetical protein CkaCkLH20_02051 [Colletotrichum karsti]|uniref:Uncharacterized protein n=1 Tax=Colletotrichum karsti TaxID=1095194 RepID=A0A9P6LPX3_9PEZI|nr:uncharacterized protein CkaCkLH20_02051 [Colletotrichum karsti]KAF9880097.1 hypothetical protein CkaCkLH20_02051 [Colletotrichum karsti]
MAISSVAEIQADTSHEPWRAELEEQIEVDESWGDQQNTEASAIILKMFLSFPEKGFVAALEAALQIGADYWAKFLPSSQDPLNRPYRLEDKGIPQYLARLYDLILTQSWLLPYHDSRQDLLVRLLIELKNLPKVSYKSEGREHHAYHDDPVFGMMCEDNWNAKFADGPEPEDPKLKEDFILTCDEWVNFSSFQARYHGAEIYEPWPSHLKYPSIDVSMALEKDLPGGKLGECRLLVASEWIIHAGKVIYEDMRKTNEPKWGLEKWNRWGSRFKEILDQGHQSDEVNRNLSAALDQMVSLGLTGLKMD